MQTFGLKSLVVAMSNAGLEHGERATVMRDGEEIEVFDHVSVSQHHYVNSVNGYETFEPDIAMGDMGRGPEPEAVTKRVADLLWHEFSIEVEKEGIEVVDMSDSDIKVL